MEDKMKLIKRNCLIIAIVGIILICVGIGFLSSDGGSTWGGGWYSDIKKQQEEDAQIGTICLLIGIGVLVVDIIYYNHSKANLNNSNSEIKNNVSLTNNNSAAKLKQLKEMCDEGIISKEEYEEKKKKILDNM